MSLDTQVGSSTLHFYVESRQKDAAVQNVSFEIDQQTIDEQANKCAFLTFKLVNDIYEVEWVEVGGFERFWRWLLSCFGCCESTVEKCKHVSMEILNKNKAHPKSAFDVMRHDSRVDELMKLTAELKQALQKQSEQLAKVTSPSVEQARLDYSSDHLLDHGREDCMEILNSIHEIYKLHPEQGKFFGLVYDVAAGDALGVATMGMTKEEAQKVIALGPLEHSTRKHPEYAKNDPDNKRRLQYPFGGWTGNVDEAILALGALTSAKSEIDSEDSKVLHAKLVQSLFADGLLKWANQGLEYRNFGPQKGGREKPLADISHCVDVYELSVMVKKHSHLKETFPEMPREYALATWNDPDLVDLRLSNTVLARSVFIPLFVRDEKEMIQRTIDICEVTHVDPRCVTACVALNFAINYLLKGYTDLDAIKELSFDETSITLTEKLMELEEENLDDLESEYKEALRVAIYASSFDDLHLDSPKANGVFSALAAAFASLTLATKFIEAGDKPEAVFRRVITDLAGQGGSANINCTVAAALLSVYLGFEAIPRSWKEVVDQCHLSTIIDEVVCSDHEEKKR